MTKEIADGGPAFPHSIAISPMGDVYTSDYSGGCMSLRDYLAAAALPAILADALAHDVNEADGKVVLGTVAKASYQVADAMLKARKEPFNE